MWLGRGVVTDRRGREVARRLEVWRTCEDGQDRLIGHWHPGEQFRVLYDLTRMRAESPGHVEVTDVIDAANAEVEYQQSRRFQDAAGEALEHGARLFHDQNNPRNRFRQMPGRRKDPTPAKPGLGGVR